MRFSKKKNKEIYLLMNMHIWTKKFTSKKYIWRIWFVKFKEKIAEFFFSFEKKFKTFLMYFLKKNIFWQKKWNGWKIDLFNSQLH